LILKTLLLTNKFLHIRNNILISSRRHRLQNPQQGHWKIWLQSPSCGWS